MKLRIPLCALAGAILLTGCFSKGPVLEVHHFRPEFEELPSNGESSFTGKRTGLRFLAVSSPVELGARMIWRVSATELVPDEFSLWARQPQELLDERLRDLLFGEGPFHSSLSPADAQLDVRLVTCEGDLHGGEVALVELIVTYSTVKGVEHRRRIRVTEALPTKSGEGLALAMGTALSAAADQTAAWVRSKR